SRLPFGHSFARARKSWSVTRHSPALRGNAGMIRAGGSSNRPLPTPRCQRRAAKLTRMRLVVWNCNMALHRKLDALLRLAPGVPVAPECAAPHLLLARKLALDHPPLWIGRNRHKGLAVLAFNGYALRLAEPYYPTLHWVAPVEVSGPQRFN